MTERTDRIVTTILIILVVVVAIRIGYEFTPQARLNEKMCGHSLCEPVQPGFTPEPNPVNIRD